VDRRRCADLWQASPHEHRRLLENVYHGDPDDDTGGRLFIGGPHSCVQARTRPFLRSRASGYLKISGYICK
jgi:hypothetical protein